MQPANFPVGGQQRLLVAELVQDQTVGRDLRSGIEPGEFTAEFGSRDFMIEL